MRRSGGALLLSAALFGLLSLTACSHSPRIQVSARFADVGSLTTHAPVMLDDIRVGDVTGIRFAGRDALVTMSIDPSAQVPDNVIALVRRTSLLGEQIVELTVPAGAPDSARPSPTWSPNNENGEAEASPFFPRSQNRKLFRQFHHAQRRPRPILRARLQTRSRSL